MFFSDRSLFSELEKIYSNSAWLLIAKQMYQSFYEMKKKNFFRIRHTKGKYFYVWPIQCDVCDYVYSTVYVGLLLLILEKTIELAFFYLTFLHILL